MGRLARGAGFSRKVVEKMTPAQLLLMLSLSALSVYLLYRAELRHYPAKRVWETEGPVTPDVALEAVRDCEAAEGRELDQDLCLPTPKDPFLLEARWAVADQGNGSSLVRLVYVLRPVGLREWLRWKITEERRYREEARRRAKSVKRVINGGRM